jgi:ribosomal-protein-alanine N-acetyltransferase
MLKGQLVTLRPVRDTDLDAVWDAHTDIASRGAFFPVGIVSQSDFRRRFGENGFWEKTEGTLLITDGRDGKVLGHIEFFLPVSYWDCFELSYQLFDPSTAGRGLVTEAVQLVVDYLFGAKKQHRIQLVIVPGNAASRRIAEKCGFQLEGTARGAFFNAGRNHDVLVYSLLSTDTRPWRPTETAATTIAAASETEASAST